MMSDNYSPSQEERNLGMVSHFASFAGFLIPFGGVLGPLVVWQLKKDESEYVDYHGKEAVNFQLTMLIALFISFILVFVLIGIPLLIGLAIFDLIIVIIAGVKANDGVHFRYPMCIRFIK